MMQKKLWRKNPFSYKTKQFLAQKRFKCNAGYPMIDTFPHGAPLGGFGAGTFARTPRGDFSVWHLFNGIHIYKPLKGCNLAVFQKHKNKKTAYVLNHEPDAVMPAWQALPLDKKSEYQALYPKSFYNYQNFPAHVSIEQFSPILPHNYRETSLPVACFKLVIKNNKKEPVTVSAMFSWENLLGWNYGSTSNDKNAANYYFIKNMQQGTNRRHEDYDTKAIIMSGPKSKNGSLAGEFCLATKEVEGSKVYFCTSFDGNGDGNEVWETFSQNGTLRDSFRKDLNQRNCALAVKTKLQPGQTVEIPFVLAWDLPKTFNNITKYYTKFFNTSGQNSFAIAEEALNNLDFYSAKIDNWHNEYLQNPNFPAYLTANMFNELYYLADGGTLWDAKTERFTYLECYDYYFYETLDVRYYGSFPLAMFWPEIEKKIMLDFNRTLGEENNETIEYHRSLTLQNELSLAGERKNKFIQKDLRKRKDAAPHDIGSPFEEVWNDLNSYVWQNSNRWKDLNSKFILMIYRAYYYSGKKDHAFLKDCFPNIIKALNYVGENLDKDQDQLPENEGFPDQTFDNWIMKGTSAYCGSLRLAALQAAIQIAFLLEEKERGTELRNAYKKAKDSFENKLWNGSYYNFDETSSDIMSAQLMGQWYLDQLHLPASLPSNHIKKTLKMIYKKNFLNFNQGKYGLVNGRTAEGLAVNCSQGNAVWLGINYAFCAHLLLHGQKKQAFKILKSVTKIIANNGFLFRTPESWTNQKEFIASMYMRPGAIWAIADVLSKL